MKRTYSGVLMGSIALFVLAVAYPALQVSSPIVHAQPYFAPLRALACARSGKQQQVGQVDTISAGLQVKHLRGRLQQAVTKMPLYAGDLLSTQSKQGASVQLCDGSMVYLNDRTQVTLRSPTEVVEKRGQVAEVVQKRSVHRVKTASGDASARNALLAVTTRQQRSTFIDGRGAVQVQNKHGRVRLKRNQETITAANAAPRKPTKVDAQRTLTWTAPLSWRVLTAPNLLSEPRRVALDTQGNLYVTDEYHNRIVKLSPSGAMLTTWGSPGAGPGDPASQFPEPTGITLDRSGNIYVTDHTSQVKKLSPSGQLLLSWGNCSYPECTDAADPRILNGPWSVTLDGAGNVYVADSANDRIVKYAPDGHPLLTYGVPTPSGQVPGTAPGVLNGPEGVAVDGSGNVLVADTLNNRIQKFSATGQPLAQWGSRGAKLGQFYEPTDLTIDSRGNIYAADSGNNRIEELDPSGKPLATYDTNSIPTIGGFVSPEGVALDAQGNMYVVDRSPSRIWKYTPPR